MVSETEMSCHPQHHIGEERSSAKSDRCAGTMSASSVRGGTPNASTMPAELWATTKRLHSQRHVRVKQQNFVSEGISHMEALDKGRRRPLPEEHLSNAINASIRTGAQIVNGVALKSYAAWFDKESTEPCTVLQESYRAVNPPP